MKPRSFLDELGFTQAAESLNGRLAMIAFAIAIIIEIATGQGFLGFLQLV